MIAGRGRQTLQARSRKSRTARAMAIIRAAVAPPLEGARGEDEADRDATAVSREMPLIGYLQGRSVGGHSVVGAFWTRLRCDPTIVWPFKVGCAVQPAYARSRGLRIASAQAEERVNAYNGAPTTIIVARPGDAAGVRTGNREIARRFQGGGCWVLEACGRARG